MEKSEMMKHTKEPWKVFEWDEMMNADDSDNAPDGWETKGENK